MEPKKHLLARQIKAARALLDWSQDDLAAQSDLSIATIRKLELGHISPRGQTTHALRNAFEKAGLEFLEPDGVRHRPDDIIIFQGKDGFRDFYDDIFYTVSKKKCEVVVVCPDEQPVSSALGDFRFMHMERMTRLKDAINFRCILTHNPHDIPATGYCEYRHMSRHYVDSVPFYIYDDKYAIIVFDTPVSPKVTVLRSMTVAHEFLKMFNSMWDKSTPLAGPTRKTLPKLTRNK